MVLFWSTISTKKKEKMDFDFFPDNHLKSHLLFIFMLLLCLNTLIFFFLKIIFIVPFLILFYFIFEKCSFPKFYYFCFVHIFKVIGLTVHDNLQYIVIHDSFSFYFRPSVICFFHLASCIHFWASPGPTNMCISW